jgi:hypothetical protein
MREIRKHIRPPARYTGRTQRTAWYVGIVIGIGLVFLAGVAVAVGAVLALLWITS